MSGTEDLLWSDVLDLVKQLDESGLVDAEVTTGGVSVRVSRHALAVAQPPPTPAPATAAPVEPAPATPVPVVTPSPATEPEPPAGPEITATMLGTLYLRPSPDADPFVQVGDVVTPDTTVAVIEVMKMMNTVVAGASGRVVEISRPEGQMVEHGDVLFRLAADG